VARNHRIDGIDDFPRETVHFYSSEQARRCIHAIQERIKSRSVEKRAETSVAFDGRLADPDEVRSWLNWLPIEGDVVVTWPSNGEAMKVPYEIFVEFYDDLWYPSSDDVWITDEVLSFLLELDHEELLAYCQLPGRHA
jgi:hypothetical protein